jgi:hypothetical protein
MWSKSKAVLTLTTRIILRAYTRFCFINTGTDMVQAQHEDGAVESKPRMDSNESMIAVAADALSPTLTPLQLLDINKIAARYQKDGDCIQAVAAYRVLFEKAR